VLISAVQCVAAGGCLGQPLGHIAAGRCWSAVAAATVGNGYGGAGCRRPQDVIGNLIGAVRDTRPVDGNQILSRGLPVQDLHGRSRRARCPVIGNDVIGIRRGTTAAGIESSARATRTGNGKHCRATRRSSDQASDTEAGKRRLESARQGIWIEMGSARLTNPGVGAVWSSSD